MDYLLEYAPIIIAGCALVFTGWQVMIQRKHNRLSVKPYLFGFDEWSDGRDINEVRLKMGVTNYGLGTAFITKFQFLHNNNPISIEYAIELTVGDLTPQNLRIERLVSGAAMSSGESVTWVDVVFKKIDLKMKPYDMKPVIEEISKNLYLSIEYESGYKEKFTHDTRDIKK